jgi:hypothetical protein
MMMMMMMMMNVEQSVERELAGETEGLGENLSQYYFVCHKSHSNSGHRGGKPATNSLSYGTAYITSCSGHFTLWGTSQALFG